MVTYFDVASSIMHITNRPFDLQLAIRITDSFKAIAANYIRRQCSTTGIKAWMKLSYFEDLMPSNKVILELENLPNYIKKSKITKNLVYPSVNIQMADPFITISSKDDIIIAYQESLTSHLGLHHKFYAKFNYTIYNGRIVVFSKLSDGEPALDSIKITSIFEDPAELLNRNSQTEDPLEVVIPIPIDYIEAIKAEILKVEFGILPKEDDLTLTPSTLTK